MEVSNNNIRIYFDMDGTLAEWRAKASEKDLYKKNYFATLTAQFPVCELAYNLHNNNFQLYVLSAYMTDSNYALDEKQAWCDIYVPFIPKENRIFTPSGVSHGKTNAIINRFGAICRSDILIDDYSKNLHEWTSCGGTGVKLYNDINGTKGTWTGPSISLTADKNLTLQFCRQMSKLFTTGESST